ncbi:PLP-dependent aminotransferase family protein [Shewanella oncorhynchi]|uniref:aminotransferase-like domain-containing protein n=1 Tax=Shewanella oncorhynchi TaxID=2726434 RepID=UPI002E7BA00B|nr:PLP-dependent aminotransferase family protein [Shewanella oncorhynchi]WVI91497.1 PLP-dependent aminotransferase family protein [Shewanella oncorhynchi]
MGTIWTPDLTTFSGPKYQRLVSAIEQGILQKVLTQGSKLPPQRRLADALGITIGTVTRAYTLAEQRGYVEARVGDGTYVNASPVPEMGNVQLNMATCQQPLTDQISTLSDCLSQLAKDPTKLSQLLGYRASPLDQHQQVFHQWLNQRGIQQTPEQLVFTHGGQQAIFACLSAFLSTGDVLLHEQYSYPGVRICAKQLGVTSVGVPLIHEGLDLPRFEALLQIHNPKLVYLTLNNQNPTCIQYNESQRQKILELSEQYQFYIIEDDVNYCLPEEWHSPLWQLAKQLAIPRVIYISSLSKLFSGGLRQGFILVPDPLIAQVRLAIHSQCWMVSPLNIEIACQLIKKGHITAERDTLVRQRQSHCIAMGERLGLTQTWRGLNGWIQLPEDIKAHHLVTALAAKGILVRNGDDFNCHDNFIRLSLGGAENDTQFNLAVECIESTIRSLVQNAYSVV